MKAELFQITVLNYLFSLIIYCLDTYLSKYKVFYSLHLPLMSIKIHDLQNYGQFTEFVDKLPNNGPEAYFCFTGKKKENGHSWCIYCQLGKMVHTCHRCEGGMLQQLRH